MENRPFAFPLLSLSSTKRQSKEYILHDPPQNNLHQKPSPRTFQGMQRSSGEQMEVIARNPWLVKAGIPLLLSAAAFITAKIMSNRSSPHVEEEEESFSSSSHTMEIKSDIIEMLEGLKRREYELERRFFIYQEMKERESKAIEIRNKLCLEMTRLEFLAREASLMEAEVRRMEELIAEYLGVVKKLETLRLEKGLVEKRAMKLKKRVRVKSKLVKEQCSCIAAKDEELTRNRRELHRKSEVIVELESEIGLIKNDEEVVTKEAYDKVVEELERNGKDQEAMENELIHLRWSNACLRHEAKRCQEQLENNREDTDKDDHLELESSKTKEDCDESCLVRDNGGSCSTQDGRFSKRKRFIRKLRKWVEGGKIDEKPKHEEMIKCFDRHSVALSEEAYENYVHPRNSFSSV